jgi:23S rRNA (guanine745-N1)-methyltransferase
VSGADLPLACSVRGCTLPLTRHDNTFVCGTGHSYDVARSGYVNLLQPQDRRSRAAGDSSAAIDARASLLAAGVGRTLIAAITNQVSALELGRDPVVVDMGCGPGDALAALIETRTGIGIDLSTAAIDRAARRFPAGTWVVANADRRLPLRDHRVDLVMSINSRRNSTEVARVLASGRFHLVAVPAADDLIELREFIQGARFERDRAESVLAAHEGLFQLVERSVVRERLELDRAALLHLLQGTYRGVRRGVADRVATLGRMLVTLASDLVLLRVKR